jgi:hypothetical protein
VALSRDQPLCIATNERMTVNNETVKLVARTSGRLSEAAYNLLQ